VRFTALSKLAPEKLAFVIADARSKMGQAVKSSGIVSTERVSVVIPLTVEAVPALLAAAGCEEVQQLALQHGAVPVVVIDQDDHAAVTFERVGAASSLSGRRSAP
jgi:hypothetical protein